MTVFGGEGCNVLAGSMTRQINTTPRIFSLDENTDQLNFHILVRNGMTSEIILHVKYKFVHSLLSNEVSSKGPAHSTPKTPNAMPYNVGTIPPSQINIFCTIHPWACPMLPSLTCP